jgi:Phage tail tube protein, GTA-gp10
MALYEGVTKSWADGEYTFRLREAEMKAIQSNAKTGLYTVFKRIMTGDAYIEDLTETIRLGLIGGGTDPKDAKRLVNDYVLQPQRFNEALDLAQEIFSTSLEGYWGEELPNPQAPGGKNDRPSTGQSGTSPSENSNIG